MVFIYEKKKQFCKRSFFTKFLFSIRGALQKKIFHKVKTLTEPPLPPLPPLGSVTLNIFFFIADLGFRDYEMDFEINLFFSLTKLVWHLEKNHLLPYIGTSKSEFF